MLHPLHIVALKEILVSVSSPRFVARLATVQALRSLTRQVLELHRLDEIGVPYQVFLSTQFTSLGVSFGGVVASCTTYPLELVEAALYDLISDLL